MQRIFLRRPIPIGLPSQAGFGSAIFYEPTLAEVDLAQAALAKYRYFTGDRRERYGE